MKGKLKNFEDAIIEIDEHLYKWEQLKYREQQIYVEGFKAGLKQISGAVAFVVVILVLLIFAIIFIWWQIEHPPF